MAQSTTPAPDSPGLPPPPGVVPDFQDPFTLETYFAVAFALSVIVTTIMVAARIYTKKFVIRVLSLEDYSCILGWTAFIVFLSIVDSVGRHGGGTHQWNVYYKDVQYHKRFSNYEDMIYSISILSTKLSLMLLIKRVFCSVQRDVAYWLTVFLIFANTGFYICFLVVPAVLCMPRSKIWTPTKPGHCLDIDKLYLGSAIFNTVSDVCMLSVPIYMVWGLQMSIRRKAGISAIFLSGGLACIASIVRTVDTVHLSRTDDYTFVHFQLSLWSTAEIAFGLICSCLVVLPRLYQHFCDITPLRTTMASSTSGTQHQDTTRGRTKRDWVNLEQQASANQKVFEKKARSGDEEALDAAIEEGV